MREETLAGGNTTGAVLIDGVVHKRSSPWTATVHALLRHLEDAGFDAAAPGRPGAATDDWRISRRSGSPGR
jgi:hypothetical protein